MLSNFYIYTVYFPLRCKVNIRKFGTVKGRDLCLVHVEVTCDVGVVETVSNNGFVSGPRGSNV